MSPSSTMDKAIQEGSRRILVIDDNPAIHEDFRKILTGGEKADAAISEAERAIFGDVNVAPDRPSFEMDSAMQGQEGVERLRDALARGESYALAFVDMRMPPGWNGLETIERLWALDANLQVVICSAHSDTDWNEIISRLGHADKLLIIKKPFEPIEILQCACAMTRKWHNEQMMRRQLEALELAVLRRTEGLEV